MTTKRDLTRAQQALNRAVEALSAEVTRLRQHSLSVEWPLGIGIHSDILRPIHEAWLEFDCVRRDLEGPGIKGTRDTSRAAALPNQGTLRRLVLDTVTAHFSHFGVGMTTDLIESRLKRPHQSISPRVHELEKAGLLVDSGTRAETRNGTEAIVYVPSQAAIDMYARSHAGEAT